MGPNQNQGHAFVRVDVGDGLRRAEGAVLRNQRGSCSEVEQTAGDGVDVTE